MRTTKSKGLAPSAISKSVPYKNTSGNLRQRVNFLRHNVNKDQSRSIQQAFARPAVPAIRHPDTCEEGKTYNPDSESLAHT